MPARPVSADHGYWPASGVEPARVAGHQPHTPSNASAASWGPECASLPRGTDPGHLDVYGHILDADYALAVVVAEREGAPIEGPFAVTLFRNPKAGQFVWADADGDGIFRNVHDADAASLFVCPVTDLPATDAVLTDTGHSGTPRDRTAWLVVWLTVAIGLLAAPRAVSRVPGSREHHAGDAPRVDGSGGANVQWRRRS